MRANASSWACSQLLQMTSAVIELLRRRSPFRSLPSRLMHRTMTQMRCRTVAVHRRWYRSLGVDHTCCRKPHGSLHSFSLTGTIFLSIPSHFACSQSSRSQYFISSNHLYVVFISSFYWRLASKVSKLIRSPSYWSTAVKSHAAVNSDVRYVVFRSLLEIFEFAAKQACKQLHCNKTKLSEPASINGLHIHRALGYASQIKNLLCTLDENIGWHIYTVTTFYRLAQIKISLTEVFTTAGIKIGFHCRKGAIVKILHANATT